jgi:radical SAM superfamily enzyme YgiQ (UPF0313 family)
MKILLVRPPHHNPVFGAHFTLEPLGLEALGGAVAAEHDVRLLDMHVDRRLDEALAAFAPDVVGVGATTADVPAARRVLAATRRRAPRAVTVIGGPHATAAPDDFNHRDVDAIVLGFGELSFAELCRALAQRRELTTVPGLALPGPELRRTSPRPLPRSLDALPTPRRELTRAYWGRYRALGRPASIMNSARGCRYRCRFCAITSELGGRYLTKSPARVVAELATLPHPDVRFADANTFGTPARMRELAAALREARLGQRYLVDARADAIARHPELVAAWRASGLRYVAIGLESVQPERLAAMNKGATLADNLRAIRVLHDHDITIIGQFMVDPDFTPDDFARLLDFVRAQRIQLPSFLITTPFPGTPLFAERRATLDLSDLARFDSFHAVSPTRLARPEFYRRYLDLYAGAYGLGRLPAAVVRWLRRERPADLPLGMLFLAWLVLQRQTPRLRREYGLA